MWVKSVCFVTFLAVCRTQGAVLVWSNYKIEISPLNDFNDKILDELIQDLGHPQVTVYKSHSSLLPEFKQYLNSYYTAYNPNGDVSTDNATEINRIEDLKNLNLGQPDSRDNILSVLVIPGSRSKREASSSSSTTEPSPFTYKTPKGPVFYKGKHVGKDADSLYGLLYSSKPLLLKTNSSHLLLGNTKDDMVQVDTTKDSFMRLNVKIHIEEDSNVIILRFIFSWSVTNYWTLKSVKISDTSNIYAFDLNITEEVSAPAHFSYHCSGETVFIDGNNQLYIYDLQTQVDSSNGKFSDAYDCVNFISSAILSGLFVTALLGVGLIIALIAISEIKTMDKFDNYKTKQLVVTVSE